MNSSSRIAIGSRVEGSYGPLVTNLDASKKRRIRSKAVGAVIRAAETHKWDVVFDFDRKTKRVSSRSLSVVPSETGIPLDETTVRAVSSSCVGNIYSIIAYSHRSFSFVLICRQCHRRFGNN